jgi:hypothetical protein|tara:strand:- start:410 stop:733 length:324 start_codon:yes stop_codon:yes gene_type:complete
MVAKTEKTAEMREVKKFINRIAKEVWEQVKLDENYSKGKYTGDSREGVSKALSVKFEEECHFQMNELHMIKEFHLDLDTGLQGNTKPCVCTTCVADEYVSKYRESIN